LGLRKWWLWDRSLFLILRFFGPSAGIDEDPVTGSAHCGLAPLWSSRLGRPELVAFQLSKRGGRVVTRLEGDRVVLAGQGLVVVEGTFSVPDAA